MSEKEQAPEAEAPAKKKKGKLPVLLALVAVLGGGGFFAMKMKGGSKAHKVELGEIIELEEILVNLKDNNIYCRTHIALQLEKGFEKKKFEEKAAAIYDSINLKLSSKSLSDVKTLDGKLDLKHEIAASVNRLFAKEGHAEAPPKEKSTAGADSEKKPSEEKTSPPKKSDWDSDSGPVLKVYFKSFATQ